MIELEAKTSKKLQFWFEGELEMLGRIGRKAAALLHDRIANKGLDADGKALSELSHKNRRWWASADDPRFKPHAGKDSAGATLRYRKVKGSKGPDPDIVIYLGSYAELKARVGKGKAHRGSELSGAMWASLALKVHHVAGGDREVKLQFTKSQLVGYDKDVLNARGKAKAVRVENRMKARMLQYSHRNKDGTASGSPDFILMRMSDAEMAEIKTLLLERMRFTHPG